MFGFEGEGNGGVVRNALEVKGKGVPRGGFGNGGEREGPRGKGGKGTVDDRSKVVDVGEMGGGGLGQFCKFVENVFPFLFVEGRVGLRGGGVERSSLGLL